MRNIYFIILALLLMAGCREKSAEFSSFFIEPDENQIDIQVTSLNLDTIPIILPNTSYVGSTGISDDRIFFADRFFCWVYEFDKDLTLLNRTMGQGRGPREIPLKSFAGYVCSHESKHYFIGTSRDMFIFDSLFNRQSRLSFIPETGNLKNSKKPFENDNFYNLDYDNMILKLYKDKIYVNVIGGNERYNISNRDYYNNTRILMEVDTQDGKINRIFGRLSPATKYMSAFWRYQYDMDMEGNFYVSYECDPLIYVYDNDYTVKYSFGHAGNSIFTDYKQLSPGNSYRNDFNNEREIKGYYSSIRKTGDYIFRTYKTGGEDNVTRMQIYSGKTLTGDVQVPDNMRILGYISPFYYSEIIADENNETLTIYRFKLDL